MRQFAYTDAEGFHRLGTPIGCKTYLKLCQCRIPHKDAYISVYSWEDWCGGKVTPEISKTTIIDGLFFDFDDAKNPKNAFMDAAEVAGFIGHCEVNFSGAKGCHLWLPCPPTELIPDLKRSVLRGFVKGLTDRLVELPTMDWSVVGDTSRVRRLVNSRHSKTGLHAIPLVVEELSASPIDEVMKMAQEPRIYTEIVAPSHWVQSELIQIERKILEDRLNSLSKKEQISEGGYAYGLRIAYAGTPEARKVLYKSITTLEKAWQDAERKEQPAISEGLVGLSAKETWLLKTVANFKATGRASTGSRKEEHKARVHLVKLANECGWPTGKICDIFTGADDYNRTITEREVRSII